MTTIRLLDARRGLNRKCEELFGNANIAEAIYRFLCDGIEECEDADVRENVHAHWEKAYGDSRFMCSVCKGKENVPTIMGKPIVWGFCPNCGAEMEEMDD